MFSGSVGRWETAAATVLICCARRLCTLGVEVGSRREEGSAFEEMMGTSDVAFDAPLTHSVTLELQREVRKSWKALGLIRSPIVVR
jgi:hypothetical protein